MLLQLCGGSGDVCTSQWQRVALPTLFVRKTSEPAAEERDGERAWVWLAGSLACPHYKPSHHLDHKHDYHFR
jgi:hypothetical protein